MFIVRWHKGMTVAALAVVAVVTILFTGLPAAGAYVCPSCYGLQKVTETLYVDQHATAKEISDLKAEVALANQRVATFFPERLRTPKVFACVTDACDQRLGGQQDTNGSHALGGAFGDSFIHISSGGHNATIVAHELTHIEFQARLGSLVMARGAVPVWFGEGLAVIVARDMRHLGLSGPGRLVCNDPRSDALPITRSAWSREADLQERPIYAMAACRVLEWMPTQGQGAAIERLATTLRKGGAFPR